MPFYHNSVALDFFLAILILELNSSSLPAVVLTSLRIREDWRACVKCDV